MGERTEMTQLTLDLSTRATRRKAGPRLAARMIAILAKREDWTTRAQFAGYGLNDRACRLGRECSNGRILRGQRGYKLLRQSTPDEIRECGAAWLAQIQAEQREYSKFMRRAHAAMVRKGEG
jgi:hypothetical protein